MRKFIQPSAIRRAISICSATLAVVGTLTFASAQTPVGPAGAASAPGVSAPAPAVLVGGSASSAAAPDEPLNNPFRIQAPRREGDAFVPSADPQSAIPDPVERQKDQLAFGYFLMELTDKAIAAFEAKDYAGAAKFYEAIAKAVPERAVAWSKLCETYALLGKPVEAEAACDNAMRRPGTVVADHTRFVELYLSNHPGALKPEEIARLDKIITHVGQRPEAEILAAQTACRLGARLEDVDRLAACTKVLNAKLPHDPVTISYSWALAVAEHDQSAAERELARAEAAGLPSAALATMRDRGMKLVQGGRWSALRWGIVPLGIAGLAAMGVYVSRRRKSVAHV